MKKYSLWIIILQSVSFVSGIQIFAQNAPKDTLRLGLKEAVWMALERNPEMAIQRLEPAIARSYVDEQRAAFDPVLTASSSNDESKTKRFLGSRPDPFDLITNRKQYNADLSETLPTGTTISVSGVVSGTTSSIYQSQYAGNADLTVTQSLLRGFGWNANLSLLRKARIDLDISRAELQAEAEALVAETERAYWDLYLSSKEVEIQSESLQLANRQLFESLERVAVGKLPVLELAAVKAEVARRESALIDTRSRHEQARLQILFLINPSHPQPLQICPIPIENPVVTADVLDSLPVHERVALQYRPDLEQARLSRRKGDLELASTKNGLLPKLDFFITLGRTTYALSFKEAFPDIKSPFYTVISGFSFDFPIPDRQAAAQLRRARKTRDQLELSLQNMERLVQKDVRSAYIEVLRTQKQISATQVTRELQSKNLEAELEKFRVGKSTNLLVLQVQRDFTESQLNEIRATLNYLNALVVFYQMEGTLIQRRGIAIPSEL